MADQYRLIQPAQAGTVAIEKQADGVNTFTLFFSTYRLM
jgi:hypothetical protein